MAGDDMDIVIPGEDEDDCSKRETAVISKTNVIRQAFHGNNNNNSNRYKNREESYQRRMVDITRDKPIKVSIRVVVPVRDHPKFNFVGKLLGPKGNSLKRLQEETMTKMAILGRGSMRDRLKEEELRSSGDARFGHLLEDLHVEITAFAPPAEAHARIAYALSEVRRFLVPDHNDEIRQEQMWEMQILNTSPTSSTNTLNSAAGGSRNSNDCGTSGLSLENGKENNGGSTCGSATGSDMLMNGGSGGIGSGSSTAAAAMNLLAASGTAGPGQLNLENLAANLQQHGFASLSNNISQTNGGSMEFGTATSSNGSLTPPELTNPISSPFSKAYKTKSPGVGGNAMTGRKRPLLTASSGADMMAAGPMAAVAAAAGPTGAAGPLFLSPTKRTVLSILARAKAAQNQHPIAAAVAASAYKHRPPPPPHPHHISAHHGLAGMAAPFHKNNLYGNPTNLLLN